MCHVPRRPVGPRRRRWAQRRVQFRLCEQSFIQHTADDGRNRRHESWRKQWNHHWRRRHHHSGRRQSLTPFQHEALETLLLLAEAIVHIRRMQSAGQLESKKEALGPSHLASRRSSFSFGLASPATVAPAMYPLPHFYATAIRSTSLSRQCSSLLTALFDALTEFADELHRIVPVPSNPRIRAVEAMSLLLQTHMLGQKSQRDERGVLLPDPAKQAVDSAAEDDDESLGLSDTTSERAGHDVSLDFLSEIVLPEAKARFLAEKPAFPVFSVYLQRLLELLLVDSRYERLQADWGVLDAVAGSRVPPGRDQTMRRQVRQDVPVVMGMEHLLLHASSPAAHPPAEETGADVQECTCAWCEDLQDRKDEAHQAAMLIDFGASSILCRMLADEDAFPSPTPSPSSPALPSRRNTRVGRATESDSGTHDIVDMDAQELASFLSPATETSLRSTVSSSLSNLLSTFNSRLFARPQGATMNEHEREGVERSSAAASSSPELSASASASAAAGSSSTASATAVVCIMALSSERVPSSAFLGLAARSFAEPAAERLLRPRLAATGNRL